MSDLILAYNTNGFYHHTLEEATRIVADFGYNGLALTPDVHHMNPFQTVRSELEAYRALLNRLDLDVVIETGARFILDPLKKHFPTFFTPGRGEERFQFLLRCIEMARILGARIVSFHSGAAPEGFSKKEALKVVGEYAVRLCEAGSENGVLLALEPEPGMVVEAQADYEDVKALCAGADLFLTLDVGHVHITEKDPVHEVIHDYAQDLVNVHLDDA
ncbi:MAG: sugar phosphate isomerase/epimerase, partial [Planctomycetes bacterium]|nr:sugar phosphate isomerase/epimerase [Planctomycetota bacterium]